MGVLECQQLIHLEIQITLPLFVAPFQLPVRDCYYNRKKKVLVVCLVGARSLLQPEKKVLVLCLAGARSLLQPEKKVLVVCLAGARTLL